MRRRLLTIVSPTVAASVEILVVAVVSTSMFVVIRWKSGIFIGTAALCLLRLLLRRFGLLSAEQNPRVPIRSEAKRSTYSLLIVLFFRIENKNQLLRCLFSSFAIWGEEGLVDVTIPLVSN